MTRSASRSLSSHLLPLRLFFIKLLFSRPWLFKLFIRRSRSRGPPRPPALVTRDDELDVQQLAGVAAEGGPVTRSFLLRPRDLDTSVRPVVLFLPGGAFVFPPLTAHWRFSAFLAKRLRCSVVVGCYPLAPESTVATTLPSLRALYKTHVASRGGRVALCGDSAGGNLCLRLCQMLDAEARAPVGFAPDEATKAPSCVVLISPALCVALREEDAHREAELEALAKTDPMLGLACGRLIATMYAGAADAHGPDVSPIHGPLCGLPPISVWVGTRDLMLLGCRELRDRAAAEARAVNGITAPLKRYTEGEGMVHSYPIFLYVPEGAAAAEDIAAAIAEDTGVEVALAAPKRAERRSWWWGGWGHARAHRA